jgi:small subunit ribosomal protein S30e
LARAGKVKQQTPKVEAQEKKKKKTGRAKKREQYIRRFRTLVAGPAGKKRRVSFSFPLMARDDDDVAMVVASMFFLRTLCADQQQQQQPLSLCR